MFDLELDEEQKMLVEAINRFNESHVKNAYREAAETGIFDQKTINSGWEFGILPSALPEQYGGFGEYSVVTGALAMEAFSCGDLALSLSIAMPGLVALPVLLGGTEDQKKEYLHQFCQEVPPSVTAALTEPYITFDSRNLKTTAIRKNGEYILDGEKSIVPMADSAEWILVYAQEDGQTEAFMVPGQTPGMEVLEREKLMGIDALPTYGLKLGECHIPAENKLGGDQGIDFDLILNHNRVALGAAAVGMAKASYEYALGYAKERIQFDEPIASRQSIAFMLAEMAIDVDATRLMVWESAWKLDQGEDVTKDAALMKYITDQMVVRVADRTVQVLGGYGYIRDYPAELWLRNARGFSSFDGLAII